MKPMTFALVVALLCTSRSAFPNVATSVDTSNADEKSIQRQFNLWVNAYEKGDAETVTSIYAPDAILLLPNSKPIEGRSELTHALFNKSNTSKVSYTYDVRQIKVIGNWAFRWGYAEVTRTPDKSNPEGHLHITHLKFIDIWKKESDGVWRIYRDSSIIDTPHPINQAGSATTIAGNKADR